MKLRKLIPAFALLLVSAVVMSTASFAWFSMNTKVTVSSMTVKATASKNLLISGTKDGDYLASLGLTTSATSMVPTSTVASSAPSFFKLKTVGTGMQADSSAAVWNTTFEKAIEGTDYIKETMWVKSTGTNASNLKAKISFTGGEKELDAALRVLIVNSTNAYLYSPVTGADSSYNAIASITSEVQKLMVSSEKADGGSYIYATADGKALAQYIGAYYENADCTTLAENVVAGETDVTSYYVLIPAGVIENTTPTSTYSTNGSTVIVGTLTADTATQIDVYIWFEGQDSNCKSTNAVTLDNTVFTIEYTCD